MTPLNTSLKIHSAPCAIQTDIFFDIGSYCAFPHLARLDDSELLLTFRKAPAVRPVRHTHPRSVIVVARSDDRGRHWDFENATETAAGGGQEMSLLYLGQGVLGGALAKHDVVPDSEGKRAGISRWNPQEHPYRVSDSYWAFSRDWGLTWPLDEIRVVGRGAMPSAPPIRLCDGAIAYPAYGRLKDFKASSSVLYRSGDSGATWSEPTKIAKGNPATRQFCEPAIAETSPGKLIALHRAEWLKEGICGLFWRNESTDGGETWSEPEETDVLSGAVPRLLALSDGRLLLTYGRRGEPFRIEARLSEDGGRRWGDTVWVLRETLNGNQGYTSSVELDGGRILTATYCDNLAGITGIVGTLWQLP